MVSAPQVAVAVNDNMIVGSTDNIGMRHMPWWKQGRDDAPPHGGEKHIQINNSSRQFNNKAGLSHPPQRGRSGGGLEGANSPAQRQRIYVAARGRGGFWHTRYSSTGAWYWAEIFA